MESVKSREKGYVHPEDSGCPLGLYSKPTDSIVDHFGRHAGNTLKSNAGTLQVLQDACQLVRFKVWSMQCMRSGKAGLQLGIFTPVLVLL